MSDFGTMVSIHRRNGASTTEADERLVKRAANDLIFADADRISDYADFNLRFGSSQARDGSTGIMISLTEYWLGVERADEEADPDAVIERDRPTAERFASALQEKLGHEFTVEAYCGHW